ncbi:alpha/beta hydrolase family protein [Paenibacillus senegalensis]|uniref:alpha/beta hydrolase family protein n=1 Tax=Paenibacillus senegalensis TaxID=1465766 RepID=UPI0002896012|nr:prolyl oligopeptidase family serine peptidase [Paenibacillus senegalensis]
MTRITGYGIGNGKINVIRNGKGNGNERENVNKNKNEYESENENENVIRNESKALQLPAADGHIVRQTLRSSLVCGIEAYDVAYRSQGLVVHGCLVVPKTLQPAPGLLYCRGGIGKVGLVGPERLGQFAKLGYVVFAPYYRGTNGAEGRDGFGGDDIYDVINALRLLQSIPQTNDQPIALFGFSRGAIMALAAARQYPQAGPVIIWGGVSDLRLTYEERVDLRRMLRRVVGHPHKNRRAYEQRSPACWVKEITAPVLIIHGTCDQQVGAEHASRLAYALSKALLPFELHWFAGEGHRFAPEADFSALRLVDQWIQKFQIEKKWQV